MDLFSLILMFGVLLGGLISVHLLLQLLTNKGPQDKRINALMVTLTLTLCLLLIGSLFQGIPLPS